MPTLPLPSMTSLSLVPTTDELEILNLPPSKRSDPMTQLVRAVAALATVEEAEKVNCGEPREVELAVYMVKPLLYGVVVPIATEPLLLTMKLVPVDEPMTNWFDAVPAIGLTESVANGEVEPMPTTPLAVER